MNPQRWTIRVRLTVLYGCLSLLTGTPLLGLTYVLLDFAMQGQPIPHTDLYWSPTGDGEPPAAELEGKTPEQQQQVRVKYLNAYAERIRQNLRTDLSSWFLSLGGLSLGLVTLGGTVVGWVLAGRSLRPLRQITTTANRVAETNLHERIPLHGPHDELRELGETLNAMLSRLDDAFSGQRRFVANASHELQTPLAINRTLLEVAIGRPDAPEQLRTLAAKLLEVNRRHEMLIEGLLTLAKSENLVTNPVPLDFASLARTAIEHIDPLVRASDLDVRVDTQPAPVHGDPVLLERLTENLVQNAVAYNEPGGWVQVATGHSARGSTLTVANTGPVVGAGEVPALFEPFRRLTDRVGSASGSGLGLSIVRSVARAHGGAVAARPREGGGLTVTVTLPASAALNTSAPPTTGSDG